MTLREVIRESSYFRRENDANKVYAIKDGLFYKVDHDFFPFYIAEKDLSELTLDDAIAEDWVAVNNPWLKIFTGNLCDAIAMLNDSPDRRRMRRDTCGYDNTSIFYIRYGVLYNNCNKRVEAFNIESIKYSNWIVEEKMIL